MIAQCYKKESLVYLKIVWKNKILLLNIKDMLRTNLDLIWWSIEGGLLTLKLERVYLNKIKKAS